MATAHCYARAYSVSNSNYVSVSDASNMYEAISTSDTTYATLQGRTRNSSTAYYCFINNFKLDEVPSNAQVSAISVKIRCYKNSQQRTGTNYYLRLCSSANWNNVISSTTTSTNISTSTATITIPTGNVTWANIVNTYKDGFSIAVPLAGNSGSTPPRIYVYGAEIEVTYTATTVHVTGVTLNKNSTSIEEGETEQLTETVAPSNATDKSVTWSTSNSSVATVSNGLVTAVSPGSANITVTTTDGGYTATCAVTVTAAVKTTYALATSMEPGKTYVVANGNASTTTVASISSYNANSMRNTYLNVTADLSSLSSGSTYHVSGSGTAYITGVVTVDWTIDTDVTYSSGVSVPFTQVVTSGQGSSIVSVKLYSSYIQFNFTSLEAALTIPSLTVTSFGGTIYMLSNQSGGSRQLVGVATTATANGQIQLTASQEAKCAFDCVRYTSGNDVTITLKNGNSYLYSDSGTGLRWNTPTTLDRFWHWNASDAKFWQFKSTTTNGYTDTSSEYKYYLELNSSNNFTDNHVTSPSIQDSTIPAIYLFTPYTPSSATLSFKSNGAWVTVTKAYKKVSGSWVEQSDLTTVFDSNTNYLKG